VVNPGPAGAAPTYIGHDPERGRHSRDVAASRSVEGEGHEKPAPQCEPVRIFGSVYLHPPNLRDQIAEGDTSIPYDLPSEAGGTTRILQPASVACEDLDIVGRPGCSR
jgi:hypothetical protein